MEKDKFIPKSDIDSEIFATPQIVRASLIVLNKVEKRFKDDDNFEVLHITVRKIGEGCPGPLFEIVITYNNSNYREACDIYISNDTGCLYESDIYKN